MYVTSNGPTPLICTTVSTSRAGVVRHAGGQVNEARRRERMKRSGVQLFPGRDREFPEMTVTNSSFE